MLFWEITRKDLHLLVRDKRAVAVLLLLPLVFIAILGMSTDRLVNPKLKVGIVDRSNSSVARTTIDRMQTLSFLEVVEHPSSTNPQTAVGEGSHHAILLIGKDFGPRVEELSARDVVNRREGRLANGLQDIDVEVVPAFQKGTTPGLVNYIVTNEVLRSLAPYVLRKVPLLRRLFEERAADDQQIPDAVAQVVEKSPAIYREIVPSYTVMFVFFLVNIMGRSFIQERELGTLRRLKMAPIRPVSVLIGKTVPFFMISIAQTSLLFLCGLVLFGMPFGEHPLALIPVAACTSLSATALGMMFATLVRTESQVSAYGNLIILTMAGISGCLMPRDWLPETMQTISLVTPHSWALTAFHELLSGRAVDFPVVQECCAMLLLFTLLFSAIGWWRFRSSPA